MWRRLLVTSLVGGLAACQGEAGPRTTIAQESVSFSKVSGYEISHERGAALLTPKDATKSGTIVIRSVRFDERHDRTPEDVLTATEFALQGLPSASVSAAKDVEDSELPAKEFTVTFNPPGKHGKVYERTHIVLFGEEYAYHVLHTAPKGHLGDIAKDFDQIVNSLEEEG